MLQKLGICIGCSYELNEMIKFFTEHSNKIDFFFHPLGDQKLIFCFDSGFFKKLNFQELVSMLRAEQNIVVHEPLFCR